MQALKIVASCVFLYWKKQSAGEMVGASQPSFVTFVLFLPQRKSVTSIYNACPWIAFSWNPKSNGWEWRDGFHPTLTGTEHWCSTAHYTFQSRKRQRVRRSLSLPSTLLHTVARDYCNDMLHLGHKLLWQCNHLTSLELKEQRSLTSVDVMQTDFDFWHRTEACFCYEQNQIFWRQTA